MNRPNLKRLKIEMSNARWSKEQDIYLIEHNELPIEELVKNLGFDTEEIMERRKILGLIRRTRQLKRLML